MALSGARRLEEITADLVAGATFPAGTGA
jgi:hypothetical protein